MKNHLLAAGGTPLMPERWLLLPDYSNSSWRDEHQIKSYDSGDKNDLFSIAEAEECYDSTDNGRGSQYCCELMFDEAQHGDRDSRRADDPLDHARELLATGFPSLLY